MKRQILPIALALACASGTIDARDVNIDRQCNIESNYRVDMNRRAFVFTRDEGKAIEFAIGGGRLFIDGSEQKLSPADHDRLRAMEAEMHTLVPEVEKVTREAVDIAFTALIEVARGLSSTPNQSIADLQLAQRRMRQEIDRRPLAMLDNDAIGEIIKPIITKYVPDIVGGAVKNALKVAFAGDAARSDFERKMKRMERELDDKVSARGKQLEPLAKQMCRRLRRIDGIEDKLDFRLPGGDSLDLLRVEDGH